MSSLHQWFNQSKALLLVTVVLWGVYMPVSHAAEITAVESGPLVYIDKDGKRQSVSTGTRVWGGGRVEAGSKGATFRYRCNKSKPSRYPKVLKPNQTSNVVAFCPGEPGPGVGEP